MSTEKERETHVYMAKLAEQAERYDGINFYAQIYILMCSEYILYCFVQIVVFVRNCIQHVYV